MHRSHGALIQLAEPIRILIKTINLRDLIIDDTQLGLRITASLFKSVALSSGLLARVLHTLK
jgi:hypothetical protein